MAAAAHTNFPGLARLGSAGLPILAVCGIAAACLPAGSSAARRPRIDDVRCLTRCAGMRRAGAGGRIELTGRNLGHTASVRFAGASGPIPATPASVSRTRIVAAVPAGARRGRPRAVEPDGTTIASSRRLGIAPDKAIPGPGSFRLLRDGERPGGVLFDGRRRPRLRFRFRAERSLRVVVEVVKRPSGHVIQAWRRSSSPYAPHSRAWNGLRRDGRPAADGTYEFRVGRAGQRTHRAGTFSLHDDEFPVRGPHSYGGAEQRFGAPRSGGRVHQGQDVFAPCGTTEVAARGGRVVYRAYDPVLYGNELVIDARGTTTDFVYAHLQQPAVVRPGEEVRTGQEIGRVGKTGNAESVGCMLHLELWPQGWHHGSPIDPLPFLRYWDGYS